ncbi:putative trehalose-phosphate phosphatase [Zostera marina]|uniref:Trehalose 6-phosphate phosphatase n=1 Tax=Zostera marina TaxID=29655 RepID=A0A0K9NP73_ZOSMR|nr:putative trehalose-phosphate phosphatase [Zostera marina]
MQLIPGNLINDVRSSGWVDAMVASSPPANDATTSILLARDSENAYRNWMIRHPSAVGSIEQILLHAHGKRFVLFLDYDGTLSPIVANPDRAFMSNAMRSAVKHAAEYFPTAIITGRSYDKVYEFIGLTELYYAGSHGMDIIGPIKKSDPAVDHNLYPLLQHQPACSRFIPMIENVFRSLVENTKAIKGARIENNKFCVTVHYRLVDQNNWPKIAEIVLDILKEYPDLKLTHGRKVLEVRPVIDWNKGRAVEFLLESLGLSNSDDVIPIYVGDDQSDEDAFTVLRKANRGFGIIVSSIPRETNAFYSLRDPSEVLYFLKYLVRWKNSIDA